MALSKPHCKLRHLWIVYGPLEFNFAMVLQWNQKEKKYIAIGRYRHPDNSKRWFEIKDFKEAKDYDAIKKYLEEAIVSNPSKTWQTEPIRIEFKADATQKEIGDKMLESGFFEQAK